MAVKLGTFTIPGPANFSITGVGFKPRWVIFLFSNISAEDTWLTDPAAGIAFTALRNSATDTSGSSGSIRTCQISERWYQAGGVVAGSFLGNITMWQRATNGSNGWANFTSSLDDDGFSFTYDPDFVAGAGGQRIYYLAGNEAWQEVGSTLPFVQGSPAYELGWQPHAFFGIGAGGNVGSPGGVQSFSLFDRSVPSVCCGDWGEHTPGNFFEQNSQWRNILDPNVNIQHYYGYESSFSPITIIEPQDAGGVAFSDTFDASRTDHSYTGQIHQVAGFSSGAARMMPLILGSTDSRIGEFTPGPDVGVPHHVDVGFTPEAVIFFSPQEYHVGVGDPATQGATGWGYCTEDSEASLIYGGHWNPPNPFQSAVMMSRTKSWVSACAEVLGSVGSNVTAGSARVTAGGFDYTTTESASANFNPILWWAIAPKSEAPGFFRVL